jgi:hypothetical protein
LLHTTDDELPANVRRARLTSKGKVQDVWVRFDTTRDPRGYMDVEVVEAPRSDAAILAAMVARGMEPMPLERLLSAMADRRAWEETFPPLAATAPPWVGTVQPFLDVLQAAQDKEEAYLKDLKGALAQENTVAEEWERVISSFLTDIPDDERARDGAQLSLILHLIRYYRPGFDEYSVREKLNLVKQALVYINDFLEALRKLQSFLEFGTPKPKSNALSGEERTRVYRMLQLEVRPDPEGYEVRGVFCNSRPRGTHVVPVLRKIHRVPHLPGSPLG